jgi:hypothetical protein
MGEEVERLRGQVGALRREVWLSRRRDFGGMELPTSTGEGVKVGNSTHAGPELPTRRLSGMTLERRGLMIDSTTKQIVKL